MKNKNFYKISILAMCCMLLIAGTTLSAQADSGRLSGSDADEPKVSLAAGAERLTDRAMTLRKARLEMRARLAVSNRLALNIGSLKMEAVEWVKTAKNRIQRLMKNSDNLTGDQLAALKDIAAQMKNQREKITAQDKILREIRKRLELLRRDDKFSEAVPVVNELIDAQKTMLELLRESESGVSRISEINER